MRCIVSAINSSTQKILEANRLVKMALDTVTVTIESLSKGMDKIELPWNDQNYIKLQQIIEECTILLKSTRRLLIETEKYLSQLWNIVDEYEKVMSSSRGVGISQGIYNYSPQNQLLKQPRSLSKTAQKWKKDSDGNLIYNTPHDTGSKLDRRQGKIENFLGTCGCVSCENILRLSGLAISESNIVEYASTTPYSESRIAGLTNTTRMLCVINSAPSSNGGTSAGSRQRILEHFGIPSYTAAQSIKTIASAVASGHGVIASVHAETLYFHRRPIHPDLHAITVTSVRVSPNGNILGFYVCDSNADALGGTGAMYYTTQEFAAALSSRECNITSTIIR